MLYIDVMSLNIQDQRKGGVAIAIDQDLVERYCAMAGVDLSTDTVKIRFRDEDGPFGYAKPVTGGYRVVINIRYKKSHLSESASYVISNTLLHELRHVGQGQEKGWNALSHAYEGWSETEARQYGRQIKGQTDLYAVKGTF